MNVPPIRIALRHMSAANEALARAREGNSAANDARVVAAFVARGLAEQDILPRMNCLTFNAWLALGRHVRRGEHGVRIETWIPYDEKRAADGSVERPAGKRRKAAFVFHVSQTDPNTGAP